MPFCMECGFKYPDSAKFCPECGAPNHKLNNPDSDESNKVNKAGLQFKTDVSGSGRYGLDIRDLPQGTQLENGRYTILSKLGEGGFGVVYKASDDNYDGELKALKVIYSENYSDRLVMHKLKAEAKNMIKVNHPHVVRLFDIHFNGQVKFLDMEYVDGGDLTGLMLECPDYKIPEEKVWALAKGIAEGMLAIHEQKLIHQDLKPENILLTKDGKAKITDFGISEHFRTSKSRIENNDVKGTYVYASPEQLIGKNVGKESDVWSFATTLYHILTGKTLYSGQTSGDVLLQIERKIVGTIFGISEDMNNLLVKCLKINYSERLKDFDQVLKLIAEHSTEKTKTEKKSISEIPLPKYEKKDNPFSLNQPSVTAKPVYNYPKPSKNTKEEKSSFIKYFAIILLIVALAGIVYYSWGEQIKNKIQKIATQKQDTLEVIATNEQAKVKASKNSAIAISGPVKQKTKPKVSQKKVPIAKNMVFVKGGTFSMGSNDGEDDEKPVHKVKVSNFYIGKHEVSQADYKKVMNINPSHFKNDNHPVEFVSFYDAIKYCNMRSEKEGLTPCYYGAEDNIKWNKEANGYRLPTEAEWEYAARGGSKSKGFIYSGSNKLEEVAWFESNADDSTKPIGKKKANELGIYDMSGNVWEWCFDYYDGSFYKNKIKTNPVNTTINKYAVIRGGCWNYYVQDLYRVSNRDYYSRTSTSSICGFRLVRSKE